MSKKERVKSNISTLRTAMFAFMTALFGIFSFIAINHKSINDDKFLLWCIVVGVVFLIVALAVVSVLFMKNLNRLEKMK